MRKVIDKINKRIHWRIVALIVALVMVSLVLFQFVLAEETPVQKRCEDDELPVLQTMLAEIPETKVAARNLIEIQIGELETGVAVCETRTPVTVDPNKPLVFPTWSPPPFTTALSPYPTLSIFPPPYPVPAILSTYPAPTEFYPYPVP